MMPQCGSMECRSPRNHSSGCIGQLATIAQLLCTRCMSPRQESQSVCSRQLHWRSTTRPWHSTMPFWFGSYTMGTCSALEKLEEACSAMEEVCFVLEMQSVGSLPSCWRSTTRPWHPTMPLLSDNHTMGLCSVLEEAWSVELEEACSAMEASSAPDEEHLKTVSAYSKSPQP